MNERQEFYSDTDPQRDSELTIMHLSTCYKLVALSLALISHPTGLSAQPMVGPSAQVARFLQPPYYGTVRVNSVYDHEYPLYGAEANVDPVNAFIITSTVMHYNGTRYRNLSYSGHNGIDYDLEYELVRAAAPGDVVYAGWDNPAVHGGSPVAGLGLHVYLRHDNGYDTLYGHMSVLRVRTNDEGVCEDDEFSCILGISGNTGHSTGPHLHFELEPPGSDWSVNPYGWIGGAGNDPWENETRDHPETYGFPHVSYDLWLRYPSITNGDVYPSGAPLHAPPIAENEPGYVTVDDGDADYSETPDCWTEDDTAGWAGDHRHRDVPGSDCTATWNFPASQPAGRYNVFVYIPNDNATTDAAQYTLRYTESPSRLWSKQNALARVNQLVYPNAYHPSSWVYAGTYYFNDQYGTDYVRLESYPLDPVGTVSIAADAVRFAPVVYRTYLPLVLKRWPPLPYTPVLNAIANPDSDGDYRVSWQRADLADTYLLQEATNLSFMGAVPRYSGSGTMWTATDKAIDTYYYRVKARNSWGDSGWSNVRQTTVLPPAGWQTITSQNFEGAFPGAWSVFDNNGATGGEYYWNNRACRPYAGNYSGWGVGGGADGAALTCGSDYPHDADSWLYYGPFDLEDAIAGELVFKLWSYTESYNDCVSYVASVDGIHFEGYGISGNTQGWDDAVLDLTSVPTLGNLLGQSQVWVALVFSSNDSVNYAEGGYVDDVVLRECLREPCPSGSDGEPVSGDDQVRKIPATITRNRQ